MTQQMLFGQDVVPLRALVYEAKLHNGRVKSRNRKFTKGLEVAVDNLTKAVEALLDSNPRRAGISPSCLSGWVTRLQKGASYVRNQAQ